MSHELHAVDDALVALRRPWSTGPRGAAADMSSVLVVEACARAGADGATVGEVARFAAVEHSTASRLVDRAVRAGFVDRRPAAADGRRAALRLTAAGTQLRERSVAFRTAWLADVLDGWTPDEVDTLGRLLGRFARTVTERGGPGALPADRAGADQAVVD